MPILPPRTSDDIQPKILVTGATGYVGQWVLRTILDRGYNARVVVRSAEKAAGVKKLFSSPTDEGKLDFVVVPDLAKGGAFDEAIVDVDGVIHVATPLPQHEESGDDVLRISVEAAESMLKSALQHGNKLKRIVYTSSVSTMFTIQAGPIVGKFSEKDWNEKAIAQIDAGERDPITVYFASKLIAERAFLKYYEDHKHELGWDVSVLNPAFVYGPTLKSVSAAKDLPTTANLWMHAILNAEPPPIPEAMENGWIDVRDLGEAHVRCLEREEAGGERIIACAESYAWSEWFDAVRSVAPSILGTKKAGALLQEYPEPTPLGKAPKTYRFEYDLSKSEKILGLRFRTKEEMVKDILEQGVREGWL